ncbi:MAG TPA: PaaI family thioesterase [Acidimicrobiales bacterium]|nr:PaaI family thioesterase [Acidimicrobiales bacterium]
MAVHALDDMSFAFATGCFVCDPKNDKGLRIPFFHDDEAHLISADFTLDQAFSGAPRFVHGGLVVTLLDEAMAWATIAIAEQFAVAKETHATFRRPVQVGQPHRVEAEITDRAGKDIDASARLLDAKGRRCAFATGRFVVLSERMARAAIGADVGDHARYLRQGTS